MHVVGYIAKLSSDVLLIDQCIIIIYHVHVLHLIMQLTLDDMLTNVKIAIIVIAHRIRNTILRNVLIEDFVADTTKQIC